MPTSDQITASQMRQRIPTEWLLIFEEWSNESLLSWSEDASASASKAYAGWELDYRLAFGIDVLPPVVELVDNPRMIPGPDGPRPSVLNEIVKKLKKQSSVPAASR